MASERFESSHEVVGIGEVRKVSSKLVVISVVKALHCSILDGPAHAFEPLQDGLPKAA